MTEVAKDKALKRARNSKAKSEAKPPSEVVLRYDLATLPSTQHRAGLAGLVMLTRWLQRAPGTKTGRCEVEVDSAGATFTVDAEGLQRLFDEVYAADFEEVSYAQPLRQKATKEIKPYLRAETVSYEDKGKTKTRTTYVYEQPVPKAAVLVDLEPDKAAHGIWVKLWRNLMWSVLRGVPATREPFDTRAERARAAPSEQKSECRDSAEAWQQLSERPDEAVNLPSTYYLGAQANTAENVGFRDRARTQFLLHFWPYVAQVYAPTSYDSKNDRYALDGSFVLAIPDVSDLEEFGHALIVSLQRRTKDAHGYRPRGAVIDLAEEAGLDTARRLYDVMRDREGSRATRDLVLGYDVIHVAKEGNNVRVLSAGRITPELTLVDEYERLKSRYWDASFRRRRIANLVKKKPWFHGFDRMAATSSYKMQFIGSSMFCRDARIAFQEVEETLDNRSIDRGEDLALVTRDIVQTYVRRRAAAKLGYDWHEAKGKSELEKKLNEARKDIAQSAFLAVRSRSGLDFQSYFAGTFGKVPQYLDERRFKTLNDGLKHKTAEVRTLTLLALSAESYVKAEKKDEE